MNQFEVQFETLRAVGNEVREAGDLCALVRAMARFTAADRWGDREFAKGVILYGAGAIGAGAFEYFSRQQVRVQAFIDDTPGRTGEEYRGVRIVPLAAALVMDCPIVISMKIWLEPAVRLSALGRPYEAFAHHVYRTNLESVAAVADSLLLDERSKAVYLTVLKANILGDYSLYRQVFEGNQYWAIPAFAYLPDSQGVMVDAGAYVGDTVEEYIWRTRGMFKQIHAFEPDPKKFHALALRARRLTWEWALRPDAIRCVPAGLGDNESSLPFFENASGADGSFLFAHGERSGTLQVRRLDDYLAGAPVHYLKADIEGYEMPLLRGAVRTIQQHRPKLAICVYHRLSDVFEIPLFIRDLVPEYKMALRHHSLSQDESVLYCWV